MQVENDTLVLFWMPDSVFSNWHQPASLILPDYPDITFSNSEAAFMFLKAATFGDAVIATQIVKNQDPKHVKTLGKRVNGFDDDIWKDVRYDMMLEACFHKFGQNHNLMDKLLATGNKTLVEASPYDKIWGIGLAPNDPRALDVSRWRGLNLLGQVLMDIREIGCKLRGN